MKKIIISVLASVFIFLYIIRGVYFSVFGSIIIYVLILYLAIVHFLYKYSNGLICEKLLLIKQTDKAFFQLIKFSVLLIIIASILFPLNDYKDNGNKYIWGCFIEYSISGMGLICLSLAIIQTIIFLIGIVNPANIKFENRKKLIYCFVAINLYSNIIITLFSWSCKIMSTNLHGASSSCF